MVGIGKALARLLDIQATIGIAAVGLMMFHITFDVFGKYLFNAPLPATLEIVSHYYMVVVVFLPLAMVEKRDAHISVEVLTQNFSDRWQKVVEKLNAGLEKQASFSERDEFIDFCLEKVYKESNR